MKKLLTLSLLTLCTLVAGAQSVYKQGLKDKVIVVGLVDTLTQVTSDGLWKARIERTAHQIALVAGHNLTSTYYAIYNADNGFVATGKFVKRASGEYVLIDIGSVPDRYNIVFSSTPLLASHIRAAALLISSHWLLSTL